jgi:hypothetical protein
MEFYSGLGPSHSMPGEAEEIGRRQNVARLYSFQRGHFFDPHSHSVGEFTSCNPLISVPLTLTNSRGAIQSSFVGTNRVEPR